MKWFPTVQRHRLSQTRIELSNVDRRKNASHDSEGESEIQIVTMLYRQKFTLQRRWMFRPTDSSIALLDPDFPSRCLSISDKWPSQMINFTVEQNFHADKWIFFLCDAVIAHILWDKKKRHPFSPDIQRAHVLFFAKHCTHVCLKNPSEQMSERSAPALLTLPIELVYRILNYLPSYDIFISAHNVCLKLNSIIDTYQPYQVSLSRHTSENSLTHHLIHTS